ncbi:MAG: FAD-linked oxidase C-terminal domain-containing protein [Pseudomonadota bacterium]
MTIDAAITRLQDRFGKKLNASLAVRRQHAQNEAHFDEALPDAVVFVQDTQDVSDLLRICNEESCPVTPWAAGTALEGQHLPIRGGISLNMMELNKIIHVFEDDMQVVVQPGVTRIALNEELRATGLFFSVDPGANASIGGMVSTRASGTTSVRYGTIEDNVMALEVVLATGRIIRTGSRARKSAAGYNLKSLMIGSEGTLGVVTEVTLRLHGVAEATSAASCAFASVEDAVQSVVATLQMGIPVARIELLDLDYIDAVNRQAALDLPLKPHLFYEFQGSQSAVQEQAELAKEIALDFGGEEFDWATDTDQRNRLWRARHGAYDAMMAKHPQHTSLVTDICVPISRLSDAIMHARACIDDAPIEGAIIGHVGDGNFHAQLMLREGSTEDLNCAKRISKEIANFALSNDGTVTGEHGIGLGKQDLLVEEHKTSIDVMVALKMLFDPKNILNPGKIFPRTCPESNPSHQLNSMLK